MTPLGLLLLAGCPIITSGDLNDRIDVDGDGQASVAWGGTDCNDDDATIGPHVTEVVGNQVDEDCDGLLGCYLDGDRDGFGAVGGTVVDAEACTPELGAALDTTDCDDADPSVNPDGTEIAGGEADEDCDGRVLCYVDADRDGYGINADVLASGLSCDRADQEAPLPGDCDDAEPTANPGATEIPGNDIDEDCVGGALCPTDGDSDGDEVCDGLDVCDGGNDALDTDGDGAPDDCDPDNALSDTDGDGLTDGIELVLGSDPTDTDSDDDGLPDNLEDANGDGVISVTETDPADPDSNDDGVCDSPRLDNDGDGLDPVDACRSVWFVDDDAAPAGLGLSWATALQHPQDALDRATSDHEVWVAAGDYGPGLIGPVLQMVDGVDLYGGWAGTEATFGDRPDPRLPTLLDADVGPPGSAGDAPHAVFGASDALLDGFELNGGFATTPVLPQGGSLHVPQGVTGLTVQDTRMSNGTAQGPGGCVFNDGELTLSDVELVDCTTTVGDGGGLYSTGTLTFSGGIVQASTAFLTGGGIAIGAGEATLTRVIVVDNTATDGGGIAVGDGASLDAVLVDLQRNQATGYGGGLYAEQSTRVGLVSSTVSANTALEGSGLTFLFVDDASLHGVSVADHFGTGVLQRGPLGIRVENSVLYSPASDEQVDADVVDYVNTCAEADVYSIPVGVVRILDDPWARPAQSTGLVLEHRLKHLGLQPSGTVCVDAGDSVRADMVYAAFGLDWRQMTTATDDRLDMMEVDPGRHYEP